MSGATGTGGLPGFRVRSCARCPGRAAERGSRLCWRCLHSGQAPPRCRVCGSPGYYCAGYCYVCHPHTRVARSCLGCLAFGAFPGRMCPGCAALRRKYGTATCPGCEREAPLDRGFCRLCRNQAMLNTRGLGEFRRPDDNDRRDAARSGLQLFFAGMQRSAQLARPKPAVPQDRAPRPGLVRVWPSPARAVQLRLVDTARDVRRARIADRPPIDPELSEYARGYVEDLAARLVRSHAGTRPGGSAAAGSHPRPGRAGAGLHRYPAR